MNSIEILTLIRELIVCGGGGGGGGKEGDGRWAALGKENSQVPSELHTGK